MSPYSASKAGVIGLVKAAGKEYATSGKIVQYHKLYMSNTCSTLFFKNIYNVALSSQVSGVRSSFSVLSNRDHSECFGTSCGEDSNGRSNESYSSKVYDR